MNMYAAAKSTRASIDGNLATWTENETNERRIRSPELDTLSTADTRAHARHRRLTNAPAHRLIVLPV